ncbi:hypothetical protein D3C81_829600 [compost metagenome]
MGSGQRDTGIVAHPGPGGDQRVVGEARILPRIRNLQQRVLFDGVRTERDGARRFADIAQADAGFEPLPLLGNDGDQADGHAGGGARGGDDGIEHRLGRRIEHAQPFDFAKSGGLIHGCPR